MLVEFFAPPDLIAEEELFAPSFIARMPTAGLLPPCGSDLPCRHQVLLPLLEARSNNFIRYIGKEADACLGDFAAAGGLYIIP
jgi:hypothetical protein